MISIVILKPDLDLHSTVISHYIGFVCLFLDIEHKTKRTYSFIPSVQKSLI